MEMKISSKIMQLNVIVLRYKGLDSMKYKIISPTVTILDNEGKIDLEGNRRVIEFLLENGISGFAPFGSTGEFTEFTIDEKMELINLYIEVVDKKVPVIAATGNINYNKTVELSKKAFEAGVDGCMILPPYYFALSQSAVYNWYSALAEELDGNIYIYNFPDRTGFDIDTDTVIKLAKEYKNIIGIKDTVGDPEHTKDIIYRVKKFRPDFEVYSGYDNQFTPNILAGGDGNISAFSNIIPEIWAGWIKAAEDRDYDKIMEYQRVFDNMMPLYAIKPNFSKLFKALMKHRGVDINTKTIFPFDDLSEEELRIGIDIIDLVIG